MRARTGPNEKQRSPAFCKQLACSFPFLRRERGGRLRDSNLWWNRIYWSQQKVMWYFDERRSRNGTAQHLVGSGECLGNLVGRADPPGEPRQRLEDFDLIGRLMERATALGQQGRSYVRADHQHRYAALQALQKRYQRE